MMRHIIFVVACLLLLSTVSMAQSIQCVGAPQSRLLIGERAKVVASGGSNLRSRPSEDAILLNLIPENEIIPIIDGPFCAGSYAWWQVDYDGERGWIAEGYGEFYWLAPYVVHRAQIGTIRIEIQPELVTGIQLERLSEPPRSQFVLEGFPVASNLLVPFIVIFDDIPENITTENLTGNVIAHLANLEIGQRYVDVFFNEPIEETGEMALIYHYVAITEDNRFIDAYFPISAPDLPLLYTVPQNDIETYNQRYFEQTASALEAVAPEAFTPSLADLDGIVRSINVDAAPEDSALFTFESSGISITYNPLLTTGITESLIPGGNIPRHIQLVLNDYPGGDAVIRIYRTEDITGNNLSALQQILARQPDNPPQIPVLSQTNPPLFREDLRYLDFVGGQGVRYITAFNEGERLYSYQGLSENEDYYVSALLPLEDDFPPPALLDNMIVSIQIGQ